MVFAMPRPQGQHMTRENLTCGDDLWRMTSEVMHLWTCDIIIFRNRFTGNCLQKDNKNKKKVHLGVFSAATDSENKIR